MNEQNWEDCELGLVDWKKHGKGLLGGGTEGWTYDCYIRYFSTEGGIFQQLSDHTKYCPFNPFDKALCLLGAQGWGWYRYHSAIELKAAQAITIRDLFDGIIASPFSNVLFYPAEE
jgi:hypothetical protein